MDKEDSLKDAYIKVLLSSSMRSEDPKWNEKLCWVFFESSDVDLKKLSIVCLGHIARVSKNLTHESLERLKLLQSNDTVSAEAVNALEDFEIFSNQV